MQIMGHRKENHEQIVIRNEAVLLSNLDRFAFIELEILTDGKVKSIEIELTNQLSQKSWWIGIFQRYVTYRILEHQKKKTCFAENLGWF